MFNPYAHNFSPDALQLIGALTVWEMLDLAEIREKTSLRGQRIYKALDEIRKSGILQCEIVPYHDADKPGKTRPAWSLKHDWRYSLETTDRPVKFDHAPSITLASWLNEMDRL